MAQVTFRRIITTINMSEYEYPRVVLSLEWHLSISYNTFNLKLQKCNVSCFLPTRFEIRT